MQKLFAIDLSMRSTALNYDPCIISDENGRPKVVCKDCMVTFISDRFLGEDFHRKVLGKVFKKSLQKYAYVIIVDSVGCNLNCWFCYAWKFLTKNMAKKYCLTSFISPERLAEQFFCKFKKVSSMQYMIEQVWKKSYLNSKEKEKCIKHIKLNLPLTRIRISGGEPLYSSKEVLVGYNNEKPIQFSTIEYWLTFFKHLNDLVGILKKEKNIHLIDIDKYDGTSPHFTCLCEVSDRLSVRFDTNGILFGNKEIAEAFIGGLYELYRNGRLNNLFIQIDYSIKGATPTEYLWSQSLSLPTSPEKNNNSFSAEEHPQFKGYRNIIKTIENYTCIDTGFGDCIDITVEKGIAHNEKEKVFLYYEEALSWEIFSKITGIKFSPVINCFDLNFGWRPEAKIYRYSNRGAKIQMITDKGSVDNTQCSIHELVNFWKLHKNDPSFKILVYPIGKPIKLKKLGKKRDALQTPLEQFISYGWILSGNPENWKVALKNRIWGVNSDLRSLWNQVEKNDILFFYATYPISGLIGMAKVESKTEAHFPLWPDEINENRVKYPLRIKFDDILVLNEIDWKTRRISIGHLNLTYYRGINAITRKGVVNELIDKLHKALRKESIEKPT